MNSDTVYDVAIIGGGAAGVMATIRAVLNNDKTILFPGSPKDKKRSRAFWVSKVENMPAHLGYSKGIEQPNKESLEWLASGPFQEKFNWKKNVGVVSAKKLSTGEFELVGSDGTFYRSKYVILCTGVMDVQPTINGSISSIFPFANIQDVDYCLRCDGHHVFGKDLAIIGHDNSAAWVAIMLFERYYFENNRNSIFILSNGEVPLFDAEVSSLLAQYNVQIMTGPIAEIVGTQNLEGFKLSNGLTVAAQISFISLGMIVYNQLARELGAELDQRGFVVANEQGQTSVDGLYVAGDLKANTKKQIYTSWDTAVNSADHVNQTLRKIKRQQWQRK